MNANILYIYLSSFRDAESKLQQPVAQKQVSTFTSAKHLLLTEELKKDFVFYKSSNFSLGKTLMRFQNYRTVCLSFPQTSRALTSLREALGFEHLRTHTPRLFQPPPPRPVITPALRLALLSCPYTQSHIAYKVHLLFLPSRLPPTTIHSCFSACPALDPSLLLGRINWLKIKGRQ